MSDPTLPEDDLLRTAQSYLARMSSEPAPRNLEEDAVKHAFSRRRRFSLAAVLGGSAVVLAGASAAVIALAFHRPPVATTPAVTPTASASAAPSATPTPSPSPLPTPSPTPSVAPTPASGTITGFLTFPASGWPPGGEEVVAFRVDQIQPPVRVDVPATQTYTPIPYSLALPAGVYHVLAYALGSVYAPNLSGAYTPCAGVMSAACTNGTLKSVTVTSGAKVGNIDPSDWYNTQANWPKDPFPR
jgi:hypothetical protein